MTKTLTQELIAPCGMNCGLCKAYQREKNKCPGCKKRERNCTKRTCPKLIENKLRFCYECSIYPCTRLKKLDKKYQTNYQMSMIENLNYIRDNGMDKFIESEMKKWECPNCNGIICVHDKICYHCAK
jgi:hypothetical protein